MESRACSETGNLQNMFVYVDTQYMFLFQLDSSDWPIVYN